MLEDAAGIRRMVLACGYVDLRKGIDGLSMIIGDKYRQNPFEKGTLFLFCGRRADRIKGLLWMGRKHTHDELNKCSREELVTMVLAMQDQMETLNENIERLIEQVRIANSYRFGRHTEKLEAIDGQLSFFNEADAIYDDTAAESTAEEVLPPKVRRKKTKGQRETDLKEFPEEILPPYSISEEELDAFYGKGNWKRMPDETYKRLRHEPESWTVEVHTVEVYVGTDGEHQDEFVRGEQTKGSAA